MSNVVYENVSRVFVKLPFFSSPSLATGSSLQLLILKISPVCCQAGDPVGLRRFYASLRGRGMMKENSQIGNRQKVNP